MKKRILTVCGAVVVCLAVVLCMVHGMNGKKPETSQGDVKGSEVISGGGDNEQQFEDSDILKEQEQTKETDNPADSRIVSDPVDNPVDFNDAKTPGEAKEPGGNSESIEGSESFPNEDLGWTGYY